MKTHLLTTIGLTAAIVATILSASACEPIASPSTRFNECQITYFDTTVAAGQPSRMRSTFDEVTAATGIAFVPGTYAQATSQYLGLLITALPASNNPNLGGEAKTWWYVDGFGARVVVKGIIQLRSDASVGMKRHELGHVFNLSHRDGSPVMQPWPQPNGDYMPTERALMHDTVARTPCSRAGTKPTGSVNVTTDS